MFIGSLQLIVGYLFKVVTPTFFSIESLKNEMVSYLLKVE